MSWHNVTYTLDNDVIQKRKIETASPTPDPAIFTRIIGAVEQISPLRVEVLQVEPTDAP